MSTAQIVSTLLSLVDTPDFSVSGNWATSIVSPTITHLNFNEGPFQGYQLNWDGVSTAGLNNFNNTNYAGYSTNFDAQGIVNLDNFQNTPYAGYSTNFDAQPLIEKRGAKEVDKDSVIDYPKTQFIYYKLKGFNPQTHTWEAWIIKKTITARPEQYEHLDEVTVFDGRNPPNYERDVFKSAPSGNELINITITGRWIE